MERQVQVLKDRTENFDDYFPCSKKVCGLDHVWRWLNLFHLFNQEEVIKIVQKLRDDSMKLKLTEHDSLYQKLK